MPNQRDYYTLLGVVRNASLEKIRKAYMQAAQRFHPDKNLSPGETEIFLDVQQAYECLSDPERRRKYDESLPIQDAQEFPVKTHVIYSRQKIPRLDEPQLVYALVTITPLQVISSPSPFPLNLCIVIDRSTSMAGARLDMVKASTIQILRRLRPQDLFSIVVFSDRAELLLPSSRIVEPGKLEARIQMLQTSGGTEIFQGLDLAYHQVLQNLDKSHVNHIVLITDGRTYGDESQCLDLADKAAKLGIGISGLGIGSGWNDGFLDDLSKRTGGSSYFVSQPQEISQLLVGKMNNLMQILMDEILLEFNQGAQAKLRYAFRLSPEPGLLPLESPIHLGPLPSGSEITMLMEFIIPNIPVHQTSVVLLDGQVNPLTLTSGQPSKSIPITLTCHLVAGKEIIPPPPEITQALSKINLYRLQEQARMDVDNGNPELGASRLKNLSQNLLIQGERNLAKTVYLEAEYIRQSKGYSQDGDKKIKYGTRALLLPSSVEEK